jgi:hypothetical protein
VRGSTMNVWMLAMDSSTQRPDPILL